MSSETRREQGRAILRDVIGQAYFDKREASLNDFNRDARALSEEYCFGEIWGRPGLERKTRSMLCIAMLVALGKPAELRLHVAGAIRNGATSDEIKEVLLQTIIYCGLPAGVDAFKIAEAALSEMEQL